MIALLRGEVASRREGHVLLLCNGVGYRAAVSAQTLKHVPASGQEATLHTHLVVRDDAISLYGFHSEEERELFLQLLAVQAVGPKVALNILSSGPVRELIAAIAGGDARRLLSATGVGKRTAERIVAELRERLQAQAGMIDGEQAATGIVLAAAGPRLIAREGLQELGYSPAEADSLLGLCDGESAEELIAGALRAARGS